MTAIGTFLRNQMRIVAPFATLIVLVGFFSLASRSFASLDNAANILTQISVSGIIAAGIVPAALEMLDNLMIRAIEQAFGFGFPTDADLHSDRLPGDCTRAVIRPDPDEAIAQNQNTLTSAFFNDPSGNDLSKIFATRLELKCRG